MSDDQPKRGGTTAFAGRWTRYVRPLIWIVPLIAAAISVGLLVGNRLAAKADKPVGAAREPARQPVRLAVARREPIRAWVYAEGTARSANREYLTFELSGRVTKVVPEKEGSPVSKGQVLAELDKRKYVSDVDSALASIAEARARVEATNADTEATSTQYELARTQFDRNAALFRDKLITKAVFDEAKAKLDNAQSSLDAARAQAQSIGAGIAVAEAKLQQAKIELEEAQIVSPIDGIVAYLNVQEGYYFTQSNIKTSSESEALQTVPIVVIDPTLYEITVDVPAFEAGRIRVGQTALVLPGGSSEGAVDVVANDTLDADGGEDARNYENPGWRARGEVYSVNPAVNPGGRSVQVKLRTTVGAEHLRDGMFAPCWIATEEKPDAVVVPFDVLLYEENRPYVFVHDPATGTVERRDVTLGIQGLTSREILRGVAAGEELVTAGRYRLVNGAPVRVLEEPAEAPPLRTSWIETAAGVHR